MIIQAVTISTILTDITTFVTSAVGWITQFCTEITGQPLLMIFVITGFVGLGVGLIRRIIRL